MEGTVRCDANYVPLSPISFLKRSAVVYGDRLPIVYSDHVNLKAFNVIMVVLLLEPTAKISEAVMNCARIHGNIDLEDMAN
nr:probable acyl-activating enzyme 1, peroxisomal [Tanacetum cinerariifolium]